MNLAVRIKMKRKEIGMTQGVLADALDVNVPTISNWETGKADPNYENLIALARVLEVTTDWLLTGEGPPDADDKPVPKQGGKAGRIVNKIGYLEDHQQNAVEGVIDSFLEQNRRRKAQSSSSAHAG